MFREGPGGWWHMDPGEGATNPPATATPPPSSIKIKRCLTPYLRVEMLFEIFWRNVVPCKVDDEGSRMPPTCCRCETVPLDSPLCLQPVIKPHFRGNRDVWWKPVANGLGSNSSCLFCEPSGRPNRKFARISETQRSLAVLAPR